MHVYTIQMLFPEDFRAERVENQMEQVLRGPSLMGYVYQDLTQAKKAAQTEVDLQLKEEEPGKKVKLAWTGRRNPQGLYWETAPNIRNVRFRITKVEVLPLPRRGE